jgi:lysozyme
MPPRKKQKELTKRILLALLFVASLGLAGYIIYQWWMEKQAGFAHYPGFGISLPVDYEIHGIDVSHHQSVISWDDVQAMQVKDVKLGFAVIKATEGLTRVDWQFRRNWRKAKEAGLPRGAYHFFLATKSGVKQADNFINTVKLEKGDLPPVLDVEETYGVKPADITKRVKEFLDAVERHYGVKPIIYTNVDFYKNYLGEDFADYPLWVAHYIQRNKPRIDRQWVFWQHSEKGRVNGITSAVDFNVFHGSRSEFEDLLIR